METAPSDTSTDRMISVDDHIIEPRGIWTERVPQRFRAVAPRIEEHDGTEYWVYENSRVQTNGLAAAAGRRPED